jgi:hypothetical protein
MMEVNRCPECGVPEAFMQGQMWLNNGDIVQRANPRARAGFIECENFDPLFDNISQIIGVSIDHIVTNIEARATDVYMQSVIPREVIEMVRQGTLDPGPLTDPIITLCHIMGFGKYEFVERRYERDENDFYKQRITRPFSLPLAAGGLAGVLTTIMGGYHHVTYERVGWECYEFTTSWTNRPDELMERFELDIYDHVDGDLELERCSSCEMPKAFNKYKWDIENGLIISEYTGRRMAFIGPGSMDQLFEELEKELGDQIPRVVVEAQRRFVRTGFFPIDTLGDTADFRTQLALRGLGNLREMEMTPRGFRMRIDNAAGYLMTIGMVQGLFEMTFDIDSHVEWELSEKKDLSVEIFPPQHVVILEKGA